MSVTLPSGRVYSKGKLPCVLSFYLSCCREMLVVAFALGSATA